MQVSISEENSKEILPEIKRAEKPITNKKETPVSFNLKTIFDKVEEEKPVIENRNDLPKEPFDLEKLMNVWNEFLNDLKSQNKIPAYNALHTAVISLTAPHIITFKFSSLSLSSEFDLQKDVLMLKMREDLQNHYIEFEVRISQAESNQNYIKSKAEIFKEMAEKNPVLLKMKNEFGLDFNSSD